MNENISLKDYILKNWNSFYYEPNELIKLKKKERNGKGFKLL